MKKLLLLGLAFALFSTAEATSKNKSFELNVVHINDHHSHLEQEPMELTLGGKKVTVNVGGMPRVAQRIADLKKNNKNTVALHAGDALSGTLYYTLFQGKADAELMNAVKFDAFTLGNHEFDDGNNVLKSFLDILKTPVISSNVIPDKGSILEGKWKPYIIKKIGGQNIGIIGLDVVGKTVESSNPGKDVKFTDEVETARKYSNELRSKGVNKIILLSHAGLEKNLEIAEKVDGIDIIITGDTHYLLGNEFSEFGLKPMAEYPIKRNSPNGDPVYIAEAWNYSYLVGHLKANFNSRGVITQIKSEPNIVIGDDLFEVKNAEGKKVPMEESEKNAVLEYVKNNKSIEVVKNSPSVQKLLDKYKTEKEEMAKKPVGTIKETIPGGSDNRIPSEKNPQG